MREPFVAFSRTTLTGVLFTMRNLRDSYGPTGFDYRHVIHANGTCLVTARQKVLQQRRV
jgi:hypothetical protein